MGVFEKLAQYPRYCESSLINSGPLTGWLTPALQCFPFLFMHDFTSFNTFFLIAILFSVFFYFFCQKDNSIINPHTLQYQNLSQKKDIHIVDSREKSHVTRGGRAQWDIELRQKRCLRQNVQSILNHQIVNVCFLLKELSMCNVPYSQAYLVTNGHAESLHRKDSLGPVFRESRKLHLGNDWHIF